MTGRELLVTILMVASAGFLASSGMKALRTKRVLLRGGFRAAGRQAVLIGYVQMGMAVLLLALFVVVYHLHGK